MVHPTQGLTKYQGEGTGHCPWSGWESAGWLEYSRVTGMGRRGGGELPLPWVLYTLAMEPGPSCGGGGVRKGAIKHQSWGDLGGDTF